MLIFKVWTHKVSAGAGLLAVAVVLLWPAVPLASLTVWFQTLVAKFPTNVLYPIFALIIGTYVALFVYDRKVATCCRVGTSRTGAAASLFGVLLGACPACIPLLAFFLPLSFTIVLGYYSWMILLGSILILLWSIWRIGGFQKLPP
jgi:hypothetical protein